MFAICLVAGLVQAHATRAHAQGVPTYDHVFVIVMENKSYGEIIGSSQAPYINSLLSSGALGASYYGVTYPSLPNYLALTGGSTFGISSDCTSCWVSASNIGDALEQVGSTWRAYMEGMPSPCYVGDYYPYALKHDPFVYYNDIRDNGTRCDAHVVPYGQLAADLTSTATTPNFGFITPDMCDDMHDCSIATGDSWLQSQVPAILGSPAFTTQRSLLAITWDEDDFTTVNQVPLILLGSGVRAGYASSVAFNHYSLLNLIESARGAPFLTANDSGAAEMTDVFAAQSVTPCTSANLAFNPSASASSGTVVQLTASATTCPNPEFQFYVQPPGGSWSAQTSYQAGSWTWNTAGLPDGVYGVGVWARQSGAISRYDAYWLGTYTVGVTSCASVALTPSVTSPQLPGTSVASSALAQRCGSAQFRWWVMAPGGPWTVAQDYSPSSFTWNTAGLRAGTYQLGVWARQPGSARAYDAYAIESFTLGSAACSDVGLTPGSVFQPAGAAVAVTAASTCTGTSFEFWLLSPNGGWTMQRGYGAPGWTWNTAGLAAGNYEVGVWVRQAGSTATYDAYSITTYVLGTETCTSVSLASSPASPQAPGTAVTLSAGASGCTAPTYEFWLLPPPGAAWSVAQQYGTGASFGWNTAGLAPGAYRVGVWARQSGSPSAYDTYAILTFWVGS